MKYELSRKKTQEQRKLETNLELKYDQLKFEF